MDGADAVTIEQGDGGTSLVLPYDKWTKEWKPKSLPPFEVIDGQHRLWAFDEEDAENFELPVVAFFGLDISWQAYLFWTINIKPKRINSSLAFDLYPLLRSEDWLDRAEGHFVYRETRSQELTEALWAHPTSPWYDHINMLGERQVEGVSQSAWIKSLMATFVRPWDGRGKQLGGLFGARLKQDGDVLGWSRAQQAAFLILSWKLLHEAVWRKHNGWAHRLRTDQRDGDGQVTQKSDPAFYGSYSLISTDQGVRGFMHVVNDLCFYRAAKLKLDMWKPEERAAANENEAVDSSLRNLQKLDLAKFLGQIAEALSDFDWRTSSTPSLEEPLRRSKLVFRGGSGYKELRRQLLEHLASSEGELKDAAARVLELV